MAQVSVTNVKVLNNPGKFLDKFQFEITFECHTELSDDLEWKLVYVGSAESSDYDQELDSVLVGPVPVGVSKFVFDAPPPNASLIPPQDLLGSTIAMITCSYKNQDFIRIGYWISNTYSVPLAEGENPPSPVPLELVNRDILADKPRVTNWQIQWD